MTSNQQLMSVLRNAGENRQIKNINLAMGLLAGVGVIAIVVLVPKYIESRGEYRRVKNDYNASQRNLMEMKEKLDKVSNQNLLLKRSMEKLNRQLIEMNNNIGKSNA